MKTATRLRVAEERLGMTLTEAYVTREKVTKGDKVTVAQIQSALILMREHDCMRQVGETHKPPVNTTNVRLPTMTAFERERMNAVLLYHLGMALGRLQERKALEHPGEDSLLRDFLTCETCRGLGFVRKAA